MNKLLISAIAAIDEERGLGKNGKIPWKIPEDVKFFRDTTRGHVVVMGRKTYDSMGKPLTGRTNIVVTHDNTYDASMHHNLIVCHSVEEALNKAKTVQGSSHSASSGQAFKVHSSPELFIIGGGEIYKAALPQTDRLYLTLVEGKYNCDAFFPDYSEFKKIVSKRKSEGNGHRYTFVTLEK